MPCLGWGECVVVIQYQVPIRSVEHLRLGDPVSVQEDCHADQDLKELVSINCLFSSACDRSVTLSDLCLHHSFCEDRI